jgi:hypothetical protein
MFLKLTQSVPIVWVAVLAHEIEQMKPVESAAVKRHDPHWRWPHSHQEPPEHLWAEVAIPQASGVIPR